jgi:hypothetical protein
MKKLPAALLILVAAALPAFANEYGGSIVETIEYEQTDPGWPQIYHNGEKLYGYYTYDSPTINGTFYSATWDGVEPNDTLNGIVVAPFPLYGIQDLGLDDFAGGGDITVSNGVLTNFSWDLDSGGIYSWFANGFFFSNGYELQSDDGLYPETDVGGSIVYGQPALIPDPLSPWPHVAAVFACLAGQQWVKRRQPVA